MHYLCCLSTLCFISVRGECSSEIAPASLNNENPISLNDTGYCFVNECTIRLKESNVLLSIINKTTDWMTATNATDLFTLVLVPSSCSLEDPEIGYFIFFVVVSFIIVSLSFLNTVLHLTIKELRTTPGVIIIGICGTAIILFLCITIMAVFQYVYRVGNPTTCAVFKYIIAVFGIIHSTLQATYLYHFAFLMYRTCTLQPYKEENKKLLYCYGVVNVVAGMIGTVPMVVNLLRHNKSAAPFALNNGYCADFFQESGMVTNKVIIYIALLAIITVVQIVFFILALTLYFLTTKRFCTCCGGDTTGQPSNIRVSITLMSAIALGAILLVILFFAGVAGKSIVISASIAVCVEQVVMLIILLTSTKIRTKLRGCFERKKAETERRLPLLVRVNALY